jgi:hypothetical protein
LDINPEGKLVREVKDILDELNIMIQIKKHQERVLAEFIKHADEISEALRKEEIQREERRKSELREEEHRRVWNGSGPSDARNGIVAELKHKRAEFWRRECTRDIETGLKDRVTDLNNLKDSAEKAEKDVSIRI